MSPEKRPDSQPVSTEISFTGIHNELDAQLHTYGLPDALKICELLHREPRPLNLELCTTYAKAAMIERGIEIAREQKHHTAANVVRAYPDDYLEDQQLSSPKQYCKRNGLDGTVRSNLKTVFKSTVDGSRASLFEDLKEGDFEDCGLGITELEITAEVEQYSQNRADKIRRQVEKLKEVFPSQKANRKLIKQITGIALDLTGLESPGAHLVAVEPDTPQEANLVLSTLFGLKQLLEKYRAEDESSVGQSVSQSFEPQLTSYIAAHFQGVYEEIAYEHASGLNEAVEEAYKEAVKRGSAHKVPASIKGSSRRKSKTKRQKETEKITEKPTAETLVNQIEITDIGAVPLDLSWAKEGMFDVSLMRQNGNAIVFSTAMSPRASTISQSLRQQQPDVETFNQLWEQARRIELADVHGRHPYIRKVKNVAKEGLSDLVILRHGNSQHNAKRIYYVKTRTNCYPPLQSALSKKGLEDDLPLLILIGETDKANQIRLYGDFGIRRAYARSKNVGAT